jgi:predicted Zn-dependent protease
METFLDLANLEKIYSEQPDSIIFSFIASGYLEQGNVEKAIAVCKEGVEKHSAYPFGHYVLGLCYYHNNDLSNAKKHLEISIAYDDKNPRAWKILAEINAKQEQSILADECNLNYFLNDPFSKAANDAIPQKPVSSTEEQEVTISEEELATDLDQEVDFDKLLDEQISESSKSEKEFDSEKIDGQAAKEADPRSKEDQAIGDEFKDDIEDFLSELDEGEPADREEDKSVEEKPQELEAEVKGELGASQEEKEEDYFDFSSVVEDIISEQAADALKDGDNREEEYYGEQTDDFSSENEISEERMSSGRPPILSPTIGEIYIAQGRFNEAIQVFKQLLEKDPQNSKFQKKIDDIEKIVEKQKSQSTGN